MEILYYYCKFSTFQSMLHTKTLWLTDLTKSNDAEEVNRAYCDLWGRIKRNLEKTDLSKEVLSSQIEMLDSTFAIQSYTDVPFGCCFCAENDLVQQWNEYGDHGGGVAVGFDLSKIHGLRKQLPITSALIAQSLGYERVIYDSRVLEDQMTALIYKSIKEKNYHAWILEILPTFKHYASFIKNPTFKDEKETRIVFFPNDRFEDTLPNLSRLESNVMEHYSLGWSHEGVSALKSITVGFNCTVPDSKINEMLKNAGLGAEIKLFHSQCSYRDRQH